MKYVVGVDVGGTFTDCVVVDEEGLVFRDKSFTVPSDPGQGMVNALENVVSSAGLSVSAVLENARAFAVGTTSLTNKLITRGGAKVGFITTRGHEDAILIGRIIAKSEGLSEAEKYDVLAWSKREPMVARRHIRGVSERMDYKGTVVVPLNEKDVISAIEELIDDGVGAIAVCLLWGFVNPTHERWIQDYIAARHPGVYVATGSGVAPILGEYERANSTILSAHLGALARREMDATRSLLASRGLSRPFLVMQSNGGCMWNDEVEHAPLNLIASGPAGGIMGCAKLGERMGYRNIVATDMGGTSFDVGVITEGAPILANFAVYDRTRIALPHIEVISIGAGGGSIAWVDEDTGLLHVGPQSAGSVPGPVAYGNGGEEPTVTDADVVLGRIDPSRFFSGRKKLERGKAEIAIKTKIADPLGLDVYAAAKGILDIVDSRMGDLIRKLTIERGVDPRDFVLFSYGGAGPTHVGAYARDAGIKMALISPYAAVFSALGIGSSDIVRVYTVSSPLRSPFDLKQVNEIFNNLESRASKDLERRDVSMENSVFSRSMEMRFRHQSHQVKVPVPSGKLTDLEMQTVVTQFVELYEQTFGLGTAVTEAGIEILIFQVLSTTHYSTMELRKRAEAGTAATAARSGTRLVYFDQGFVQTPVYEHSRLEPGNVVVGPALIEAANTTVPLHPGHELTVDAYSNLTIRFPSHS